MLLLFYIALILLIMLFVINISKKAKHRIKVARTINPKESEVEILFSIEKNGNNLIFISGKISIVKNLCESIYIPLETNNKGEIRFATSEFSEFFNSEMEKTIQYYYDTSERYRIFLAHPFGKNILYSVMPFSYAMDEVKERIQKMFYEMVRVCSEKKCSNLLIPLFITDRLDISATILAEYAVKPILLSAENYTVGKICLFHENERLLWRIIELLK